MSSTTVRRSATSRPSGASRRDGDDDGPPGRPGGRAAAPVGATVLVVEDELNIGQLLRSYLQRDGYRVVWVRSGEEALTELARHDVRIVVLDIGLPGMDGFEVCRRVRARSSVPIVMLTARDEEPDRVAGLELGADDYVTKPFSPRELTARHEGRAPPDARRAAAAGVLALADVEVRRDAREVPSPASRSS